MYIHVSRLSDVEEALGWFTVLYAEKMLCEKDLNTCEILSTMCLFRQPCFCAPTHMRVTVMVKKINKCKNRSLSPVPGNTETQEIGNDIEQEVNTEEVQSQECVSRKKDVPSQKKSPICFTDNEPLPSY